MFRSQRHAIRGRRPSGGPGKRYVAANRIPGWLVQEMPRRGIRNNADLAEALKVAPAVSHRWLKGRHRPSAAACEKIADVSGVSVDFVLGLAGHRPRVDEDVADSLAAVVFRQARSVRWNESRLKPVLTLIELNRAADRAQEADVDAATD